LAARQTSPEEQAALDADQLNTDKFRQLSPAQVERDARSLPAELTLGGSNLPLRAGERRQLTIDLRNADGILALDLSLQYDPSRIRIVAVEAAGIGSGFSVAQSDENGTHRVAAYGVLPLTGSGSVMTVTIEALKTTGKQAPLTLSGKANEGQVPIRVRPQQAIAPGRAR
jgi:hypothetical protein